MSVEFRRGYQEHILAITPSHVPQDEYEALLSPPAKQAISNSLCMSAWAPNGTCLGIGGVLTHWKGRGEAWLLIDQKATFVQVLAIVRKLRAVLAGTDYRRIEMVVKEDHGAGHKLAELCGFRREFKEPMRAYGPHGEDMAMYVRLK